MQKTMKPAVDLRADRNKKTLQTLTVFLLTTLVAQPGLSDTSYDPLRIAPQGLGAALKLNAGTFTTERSIFDQHATDHPGGSRFNLTLSNSPLSVSIFQNGLNQEISLQGRGESNHIALQQTGMGNQITGQVSGQSNAATVTQFGRLNSSNFMQYGVVNSVFIQQGTW